MWLTFVVSRLLVWVAAAVAAGQFRYERSPSVYDPLGLTHPFASGTANVLIAPLARWDSAWYLTIARYGYGHSPRREAFFPLYPALIHVLGALLGSDLIAGVVISLVALLVALGLLHKLVALDFSDEVAAVTVALVAFCPVSFFFSAVYTESLFLALSVGAIYCARRELWLAAGLLGMLAAASRDGGWLLLAPVLVIYFYGPRGTPARVPQAQIPQTPGRLAPLATRFRPQGSLAPLAPRFRPQRSLAAVALIPCGLLAYIAYLQLKFGQGREPFSAERLWNHQLTWPLGGIWQGFVAAFEGVRQLIHGSQFPIYFHAYGTSSLNAAVTSIELLLAVALAIGALIAGVRKLPIAYTVYALAGLALPLTDPVTPQPLTSLPRYELVLFPLFIWAAQALVRRRWTAPVIVISSGLLVYFTARFATWYFIA